MTSTVFKAPDGSYHNLPDGNEAWALEKGWKPEEEEHAADRAYLKEHPVKSVISAAAEGINEATFGLPQKIAELTDNKEHIDSNARLIKQAGEEHPIVKGAAEAGTSVATALATAPIGGALGGAAEAGVLGAGEVALEKAGLEALAAETAPSALKQVAGRAVNYAVQGAVTATPKAAVEAYQGDYEQAAETLAWGAGAGLVLGTAARAGQGAVRGVANKLVPILEDTEGLGTKVADRLAASAKKVVGGVGGALGNHVIPFVGGVEGYKAGEAFADRLFKNHAADMVKTAVTRWAEGSEGLKLATSYLKELAKDPSATGLGTALAQQGDSVLAQRLAKVPAMLTALAANEGKVSSKKQDNQDQDFQQLSQHITGLASNPIALTDATAQVANVLDHGTPESRQIALATQGKLIDAVGYLNSQLPKPSTPPVPFQAQTWEPTQQEVRSFLDKAEIVRDPLSVFHHLESGTLTDDHVAAMKALYPRTYESIQKAVMETSTLPNAPKLPYTARIRLSRLMGVQLDQQNVAALQSTFGPPGATPGGPQNSPPPSSNGFPSHGTNIKGMPPLSTSMQRVANDQPGRMKAS